MCENALLNERVTNILVSLYPSCQKYVPNQNSSVLFFPAYWGEKEDLSAAISYWSTGMRQELERGFWGGMGWRYCSWLVDGGRLAGCRELGGVAV